MKKLIIKVKQWLQSLDEWLKVQGKAAAWAIKR